MANEHWTTKCRSFESNDLAVMEDTLNKFFENKFIISSPIWFNPQTLLYDCMVYYKVPPLDVMDKPKKVEPKQIEKKSIPPSERMVFTLKKMGYNDGQIAELDWQSAYDIIKKARSTQ